ncbi:MAG: 3-isopropylmalate dehydratase small subunit [Hydrotalea sp.]|nr:3-isopropylmalate dehydratase small subunit [Hydrotalea sp.]
MDKFNKLHGVAAPLPIINVDTDMIIPKQFLKTIKRTGLGKNLFDEMRYDDNGQENPDFILNKPAYRHAAILIAGDNFGCGSSREHAVWAISDFGIKAIISESFADIFFNNASKNGILLITLPREQVQALMKKSERGQNATMTIDLEQQTITDPDGVAISFDIEPFKKQCLLNGLDDIALTTQHEKDIVNFESRDQQKRPWL